MSHFLLKLDSIEHVYTERGRKICIIFVNQRCFSPKKFDRLMQSSFKWYCIYTLIQKVDPYFDCNWIYFTWIFFGQGGPQEFWVVLRSFDPRARGLKVLSFENYWDPSRLPLMQGSHLDNEKMEVRWGNFTPTKNL